MTDLKVLEDNLWASANKLRANSNLSSAQYSQPVLGLLFLRYADYKFSLAEKELEGKGGGRMEIGPEDYVRRIGFFLPQAARFSELLNLPEGEPMGQRLNDAMKMIEQHNPNLKDVLPKTFTKLENQTLADLLKLMNSIPMDAGGDVFGKLYEFFLGKFALAEGQLGGEFFTPTSIVELIVNVIEPYGGRILDPACGSGGMFVQSANFIEQHREKGKGTLSIYGQEKTEQTVRIGKMNLTIHGLEGDIREGNSYYDPLYVQASGGKKFDYVMANPPFNVKEIDKERLKDDPRFPYGMPSVDNGNYLWIQMFAEALNDKGRAGFVMANSASDARGSEQAIRQKMIEDGLVDVMIAISSNFFYTVTLPCTLWFLDKGKKGTEREDQILFIDARHIFRQVTRAIRDFEPAQMEFLSNIVRLYRGEEPENLHGSEELMQEHFPDGSYADIAGLCKVATRADVEKGGWSLNPGRYVGVAQVDGVSDVEFVAEMERFQEEFETLTAEAHGLEEKISSDLNRILGA